MGTVFHQEITLMKGQIVIYRTSLGSRSPRVANCVTVAGNRGEPSGESQLNRIPLQPFQGSSRNCPFDRGIIYGKPMMFYHRL